MLAVLFLYLKESQLIVANLVSDSFTAKIIGTETLEGHLQKEGGYRSKVLGTHSVCNCLFTVAADGP